VIKVEPLQASICAAAADREGPRFPSAMLNSNKKPRHTQSQDRKGRDLLRELAARADILLENFAPGVMDRLGLALRSAERSIRD